MSSTKSKVNGCSLSFFFWAKTQAFTHFAFLCFSPCTCIFFPLTIVHRDLKNKDYSRMEFLSFSWNTFPPDRQSISLVAQRLKCLPAVQETWVQCLGGEDPMEKGVATHSSTLAWRIPWTEEPGGLQSTDGVPKSWTRLSDFTFTFSLSGMSQSASSCFSFFIVSEYINVSYYMKFLPCFVYCLLRLFIPSYSACSRSRG